MSSLPAIQRPNGELYRPRKIVAHSWDNDAAWGGEGRGVLVVGTHDVDRARRFAAETCELWYGMKYAVDPEVGWFRLGYGGRGEREWTRDEARGAAGVMFTASDEPEERP